MSSSSNPNNNSNSPQSLLQKATVGGGASQTAYSYLSPGAKLTNPRGTPKAQEVYNYGGETDDGNNPHLVSQSSLEDSLNVSSGLVDEQDEDELAILNEPDEDIISGGSEESKRRSHKRRRSQPTGPSKPPISAYQLFNSHAQRTLRRNHPQWGLTEVNKEVGRLWSKDSVKERYEKLYANMMIEYWWSVARYNVEEEDTLGEGGEGEEEDELLGEGEGGNVNGVQGLPVGHVGHVTAEGVPVVGHSHAPLVGVPVNVVDVGEHHGHTGQLGHSQLSQQIVSSMPPQFS